MVDTNSDPEKVDFAIPANDDATKSILLITDIMCKAIEEGLNERKSEKDKEVTVKPKKTAPAEEGAGRHRERKPIRRREVAESAPEAAEEEDSE